MRKQTQVTVDYELLKECEAKTLMHQGSVLSPFLFTIEVDKITDLTRDEYCQKMERIL